MFPAFPNSRFRFPAFPLFGHFLLASPRRPPLIVFNEPRGEHNNQRLPPTAASGALLIPE
jgi:hypothetical protein